MIGESLHGKKALIVHLHGVIPALRQPAEEVGIGGLLVPGNGPWWFPLVDLFSWNKEIAFSSAQKLLGYRIERFATGHMGVREGGLAKLHEVLARATA